MKDKHLLWIGLGAGGVAIAAFLLGWLFFWPTSATDDKGKCGMMSGQEGIAGMMGSNGMMSGMMDGMMGSGGINGMSVGPDASTAAPLTIDQAADAARRYVDGLKQPGLKLSEMIEFTNGFYARFDEQGTGAGAMEVIVNRITGVAASEPGPGKAWNTKYGSADGSAMGGMMSGGMMSGCMNGSGDSADGSMDMSGAAGMMDMSGGNGSMDMSGNGMMDQSNMGGMMGGDGQTAATTDMPVKKDAARDKAQKYLDRQLPGTVAGEPVTFYGYYTIKIEKEGKPFGILSVAGDDGQVWFHSWYGAFLSQKKY